MLDDVKTKGNGDAILHWQTSDPVISHHDKLNYMISKLKVFETKLFILLLFEDEKNVR